MKFDERNKITFFENSIGDNLDQIHKICNDWFINNIFLKKYVLDIDDLKLDIDYLFAKCQWLIELSKSLGYTLDVEESVNFWYNLYCNNGANHLVTDERYCPYRNIILNKKQIQEKNNKLYNLLNEL